VLRVPTLEAEPGSRIEIADVLLVSDGDKVTVGSPTVGGATVVAEVVDHGKGRKVINFKYKAKVRYRRKRGHRQAYTELRVREILTDGAKPKVEAAAARPARARRAAAEAEAPAAEAPAAEAAEAPARTARRRTARPATDSAADTPAAKPAPRRRRTAAADSDGDAKES
jgi:large subunit ribosomal protein L21